MSPPQSAPMTDSCGSDPLTPRAALLRSDARVGPLLREVMDMFHKMIPTSQTSFHLTLLSVAVAGFKPRAGAHSLPIAMVAASTSNPAHTTASSCKDQPSRSKVSSLSPAAAVELGTPQAAPASSQPSPDRMTAPDSADRQPRNSPSMHCTPSRLCVSPPQSCKLTTPATPMSSSKPPLSSQSSCLSHRSRVSIKLPHDPTLVPLPNPRRHKRKRTHCGGTQLSDVSQCDDSHTSSASTAQVSSHGGSHPTVCRKLATRHNETLPRSAALTPPLDALSVSPRRFTPLSIISPMYDERTPNGCVQAHASYDTTSAQPSVIPWSDPITPRDRAADSGPAVVISRVLDARGPVERVAGSSEHAAAGSTFEVGFHLARSWFAASS